MPYSPSKSPILSLWKRHGHSNFGRWLVSQAVCIKAPYFRTIKPRFTELKAGHVEVFFKKRWGVTNHINTVHAIAMCNAAELAGGVCLDVSLDSNYRWIPVGMEVKYQKMAKTDLTAVCQLPEYESIEEGDIVTPVIVSDSAGQTVFKADITMRVTRKKN